MAEITFLTIFLASLALLAVTFFLGELFEFGGEAVDAIGGAIGSHVDIEIGTDGSDLAGDTGGLTPTPFSSRMLFAFLTVFGGVGFIGVASDWSIGSSTLVAIIAALALSAALYFAVILPLGRQQGSQSENDADLMGLTGVATSLIPVNGLGEVTVVMPRSGARRKLSARSADQTVIPNGMTVKISNVTAGAVEVVKTADSVASTTQGL